MQTSTGQKMFSIPALLLFTFISSSGFIAEKMPDLKARISTRRTSSPTPQSGSGGRRTAKPRMIVSWYGEQFQGRQTASGETFDPAQLTAANRTLPFGSLIRLTAPTTGRSVVVRVNDRGPWQKGRDFDLSEAAATELGIHDKGIAIVEASLAF